MMEISTASQRIYRLDKFVVPDGAREEFLSKVQSTHELLRSQPGFIQDFLLEQPSINGVFNFATLVEWRNEQAVANARSAVMAMHERIGFNAQELLARLGIKADLGNYQPVIQ